MDINDYLALVGNKIVDAANRGDHREALRLIDLGIEVLQEQRRKVEVHQHGVETRTGPVGEDT